MEVHVDLKKLYLYVAAGAGLAVSGLGSILLLYGLFALTPLFAGVGVYYTVAEQIRFGLSCLVVGLPVWYLHFRAAERMP